MTKWIGYAPDADERIPGVWTNCDNVIPTVRGFAAAPYPEPANITAALATGTCQGAANLKKLDGTNRFFAGTGTKLYEAAASSWTDRTRASGGDYAPGATVRWRFAQYNDVSLAVAKSDTLQASSSGAFANVTGAPKAAVVETTNNFVLLFNTNEATYSDALNRWWCSALGDHTDWTPDVATQCATGILSATSGAITAGRRFGEGIIAYKLDSMYYGVYVGPPAIWEFRLIPGEVGALSQEVVIDISTDAEPRHIFMGTDDFYSFDGSRPVPIGFGRIKQTVFNQLFSGKRELCCAVHDEARSIVYFFYPSSDSNTLDKAVVYNYKTDRWGVSNRGLEFAVLFQEAAKTYSEIGDAYATYGDITGVTYGNLLRSSNNEVVAIFQGGGYLRTMTAANASSTITTGDHGDDDVFTLLHRVKIQYQSNPTSSQMVNYYKYDSGDSLTTDATTAVSEDRFDVLRSARWHRLRFDFTGDWEAYGHRVGLKPEANE